MYSCTLKIDAAFLAAVLAAFSTLYYKWVHFSLSPSEVLKLRLSWIFTFTENAVLYCFIF